LQRGTPAEEGLSLPATMASLIYNVTIKISTESHLQWVEWMRNTHIPEVMATACFSSFRFLHLEGYDDDEGITYAAQYTCPSRDLFDIYNRDHAPALQAKTIALFEGKFVAFRTILEVVEEG
jgi:hypothetical protein